VYNKVSDSGDEVIEKLGFSIVDTHEPAVAILLPVFFYMVYLEYKNEIFLVGRHQGVRRVASPGLHHIKSVIAGCRNRVMKDLRRLGLVRFFQVRRRLFAISKMVVYWGRYPRAAKKWWRGEGGAGVWWGDLMRDTTPFS
jgi:hypothetical protein